MERPATVIPIHFYDADGLERRDEPVRAGVPLPRGFAMTGAELALVDQQGLSTALQSRVLATWPDRSIKWLLLDTQVSLPAHGRCSRFLRHAMSERAPAREAVVRIDERGSALVIDTGTAVFSIPQSGPLALAVVGLAGKWREPAPVAAVSLTGADGRRFVAVVNSSLIEDRGPLRATCCVSGMFQCGDSQLPVRFTMRLSFFAGSGRIEVDFLLVNPQAAHHAGGLWDLGDPASVFFEDLSLEVLPGTPVSGLRWFAEHLHEERHCAASDWLLYQDSSGGEYWDSTNHVAADGKPTVAFRGYRVSGGVPSQVLAEGRRATPAVVMVTGDMWIAGTAEQFWQNFPKALRYRQGCLAIGLFPGECQSRFELQGGEQKRQTVFLEFGAEAVPVTLPLAQHPVVVSVDPEALRSTAAIPYFAKAGDSVDGRYEEYIASVVEGSHSAFAKREIIDEYGWRNFGDLYADHEAVRSRAPRPLISHYNNQYDFVSGAAFHYLRTGDRKWRQLMQDAARHVIDIDIYHTDADRAVFNGGLFWHTDHYQDAATSTHRTYSAFNAGNGNYGGGPSNEHNYTSGLLLYHYLTGDGEARMTVLGLRTGSLPWTTAH